MRTKAAELIDKVNEFTELSISIDSISLRNNAADFQVFIGCRVSALRLLLPGEACEGGKTGRRRKKKSIFLIFFFFKVVIILILQIQHLRKIMISKLQNIGEVVGGCLPQDCGSCW